MWGVAMADGKELRFKWACPKCGAGANGHGDGGRDGCIDRHAASVGCLGFICECEDDTGATHGYTLADPCLLANCYHCGWGGRFPQKPKGLAPWEKKALEAGWSPPADRARELGGSVK